jgi:hypothetical protein
MGWEALPHGVLRDWPVHVQRMCLEHHRQLVHAWQEHLILKLSEKLVYRMTGLIDCAVRG